jgi:hypothetical protein
MTVLGFLNPTAVSAYSRPAPPSGLPPGLDAMSRLTAGASTAGLQLGHEATKYASLTIGVPFMVGIGAGAVVEASTLAEGAAIQFAVRFPLLATVAQGAVYGLTEAPAPESALAGRGASRLVALDTNAVISLQQARPYLLATDRLVVTPNVVGELERHPEVLGGRTVAEFLAQRNISVTPAVEGASVPASKLMRYAMRNRDLLEAEMRAAAAGGRPLRGVGLPKPPDTGDALNLVEAAAVKADLFLTLDHNSMAPYYGYTGTLIVPFSGPAAEALELRFLIAGPHR